MPKILDGACIRDQIQAELKPRIEALTRRRRAPGLAVILAGNNPASEIYVRNKVRACHELGIHSETHNLPATVAAPELLALIAELNARPDIDGILVQLPLPKQIDSKLALLALAAEKDVDGFHPTNVGNLVAGRPSPRPCTPAGIIQILRRYNIPMAGRRAVVVGRSDIVGKPAALMLLQENATVTICHSKTPDLPAVCREADILVAAIGRPAFITADFVRPGATIIDVGINRVEDRAEAQRIFAEFPERLSVFERKGSVLVGDVHPAALRASGAYTPVPGGVGLLTVAMLMANTVEAAERWGG